MGHLVSDELPEPFFFIYLSFFHVQLDKSFQITQLIHASASNRQMEEISICI